jgi:L-amino acid N-acyltransferase YncA
MTTRAARRSSAARGRSSSPDVRAGASVRPAGPADAPALAALRHDFRASLGTPVEGRDDFVARCGAWMAGRLAGGLWRAWVAEAEGEVVGTAWVQLIEKVPNPTVEAEHHAYVTNVYVRPAWRGGLGSTLVATALAWCEAEGVHSVVLWPTERSAALYRRHGFAAPDALLERELGLGPDRSLRDL